MRFFMTGRAAVFVGPNRPFEMREYPAPDPAPDAVIVKVSLANICGSDLHFWRGKGPKVRADIPQVLGHEMVGVVHKLGRGVTHDSAGQIPIRPGRLARGPVRADQRGVRAGGGGEGDKGGAGDVETTSLDFGFSIL